MRKFFVFGILTLMAVSLSFTTATQWRFSYSDSNVSLYQRSISEWPKPAIDSGIVWSEFSPLEGTASSYFEMMERPVVELGKLLFFDSIPSVSNQIFCTSCHNSQAQWT